MKKSKRILSVVFALMIVIILTTLSGMTVHAENLVTANSWEDINTAITNNNLVLIKLGQDITASSSNSSFTISSGKTICINLNGHKLDGNNCNSSIFAVTGGSLVIIDSTADSTTGTSTGGMISGCKGGGGSSAAIHISGGTVTMESGKICNNSTNQINFKGSTVYINNGTFNLQNGSICNNTGGWGTGVFIDAGTFNMSGGTITNNTANSGGGAVELETASSIFNMSGGSITGNKVIA